MSYFEGRAEAERVHCLYDWRDGGIRKGKLAFSGGSADEG